MRKIASFIFILLIPASLQGMVTSHKLDSLFTAIENYHKGMGSVSVFQDGKEIYQRHYGYSDIEHNINNSTKTKFRIGSISKTFTAAIIMKLIEEGKLSTTTKLAEFYPQIPNSDKISIEDLLRHRSGIVNFTNAKDYDKWSGERQTKEQLLNRIISGGISFEPDKQFQYSNSNYVLLTYIAEDATSKSFSDLLTEFITIPCGLSDTYIGKEIDPENSEAFSYIRLSSSWKKATETDMSIPLGSGFIVSTPHDLNKFLSYLFTGKIVNTESLNHMIAIKDNFGIGLFKKTFHDKIAYGHTGGIDSFQSVAFYFPDSKTSISLVENGVVYMLNKIISGCLSIYWGKEYNLPAFINPIEITSEELEKFLGVYSSADLPVKLSITKKGNTLVAQITGQQEVPLEYTGRNIFQCEALDLVLIFEPEKNNKMTLKQLGMTFEFTKD